MAGWIKLKRSLLEWEWYSDHNATRLLVHLLVSVNYEDKRWRGIMIKAGSMALSWDTLSEGSGLSVKQCRVAMDKLEKSGEVGRERAGNFQVVSLVKWEKIQSGEKETDEIGQREGSVRAGKGQGKGRRGATTKEYKEREEGNNLRIEEKKEGVVFPFSSSEFLTLWENWKVYKKKEFRFSYRSIQSEQAALMKVQKLSAGEEKKATEIILQSMSNGWQGFFDIKENGTGKNITGLHGAAADDYRNRKIAELRDSQRQ